MNCVFCIFPVQFLFSPIDFHYFCTQKVISQNKETAGAWIRDLAMKQKSQAWKNSIWSMVRRSDLQSECRKPSPIRFTKQLFTRRGIVARFCRNTHLDYKQANVSLVENCVVLFISMQRAARFLIPFQNGSCFIVLYMPSF